MKRLKQLSLIFIVVLNLVLISFLLKNHYNSNLKIGVVNVETLFNKFEMKEELDGEYMRITKQSQNALDSLTTHIQRMDLVEGKALNRSPKLNLMIVERDKIAEQLNTIKQEFESQIWNRLDLIIADFGEQNEHLVLIGNDDKSKVLYTKETIDITQDLIRYANKKYSGR